jgi:hypothetical protein
VQVIAFKNMKKYVYSMVALIIVVITICNMSLSKTKSFTYTSILDIEAVSGCEVDSDASKNKGYCIKKYKSTEDVCVSESCSGAVRCSGNY